MNCIYNGNRIERKMAEISFSLLFNALTTIKAFINIAKNKDETAYIKIRKFPQMCSLECFYLRYMKMVYYN